MGYMKFYVSWDCKLKALPELLKKKKSSIITGFLQWWWGQAFRMCPPTPRHPPPKTSMHIPMYKYGNKPMEQCGTHVGFPYRSACCLGLAAVVSFYRYRPIRTNKKPKHCWPLACFPCGGGELGEGGWSTVTKCFLGSGWSMGPVWLSG